MRIWRIIPALVLILCFSALIGCGGNDADDSASSTRAAVSGKALKGKKIDASGNDADDESSPPSRERIIENPDKEDDGSGRTSLSDRNLGEPAEPIKGPIIMQDLVYPIYSITEGGRVKQKVGDADNWGLLTSDPITKVWLYYSQILDGRDTETENNFSEENEGNQFATIVVRDRGNTFTINLTQTATHNRTHIRIFKT